ncbi:TPA: hypothetical protein DDW35_02065 [Candidatus Sumerlaeota bacterium]|jgi:hypothetical protein|nr:hypothetical protein [Candidatus Sumerlaeota bacterium]
MGAALERFMACPSCAHENELPYLLCEKCGTPRAHLSRWRVTCNISAAFTTLLLSFHFRDQLWVNWNWPLYLLFSIFFTQFTLFTAPVGWGVGARFSLWYAGVLGFFFGFFFLMHQDQLGIIFVSLNDFQDSVLAEPLWASGIATGVLLLICGPTYYIWGKRYGWVNAYRLVLIALGVGFGVILAAVALLEPMIRWHILSDDMTGLNEFLKSSSRKTIEQSSALFSATSLRIFLFEIVVFSALRGAILSKRHVKAATRPPAELARESAFVRSAFRIAQWANSFIDALEEMVRYLLATVLALVADIGQVLLAFMRELVIPAVALIIASVLCHQMSFWFEDYVKLHQLDAFIKLSGGVLVLVTCALFFVACKTNYRWKRVFGNLANSIGWLLPNLLLFFLLLSISLYLSSKLMTKFDTDSPPLPFQVGILTQLIAVFLIVLVGVMFYRKRSLLFTHPEVQPRSGELAVAAGDLFENEDTDDAVPETSPKQSASPKKGLWHSMKKKVQSSQMAESVREKSEALGLDTLKDRVFEIKRELVDWKSGMPPVVREMENLRQQFARKKGEMVALESTRDAVSEDLYMELRARYESEYTALTAKIKEVQTELNALFDQEKDELTLAKAQLEEAHTRQNEIDRLRNAGAISDKEARARQMDMRGEIRDIETKINMHREWVEYMQPHASNKV